MCVCVCVYTCIHTYIHAYIVLHLSVHAFLCSFHLLVIVNNAALIMGIQVSICDPALNPLGNIPRNGIDE